MSPRASLPLLALLLGGGVLQPPATPPDVPAERVRLPAPESDEPGGFEDPGAAATAVLRLELRQDPDGTVVRLRADGWIEPAAVVRAEREFRVLLPFVDLRAVVGAWAAETPEVTAVRVGEEVAGGAGLALALRAGVSCDLDRVPSGMEIHCASLPRTAPDTGDLPAASGLAAPPPPDEVLVEALDPITSPASFPAAPGSATAEPPFLEAGGRPPQEEPEADPPPNPGGERAVPVTLDFRDADLRDVLRVLSEVSGLDFVLQPGVSGRVSLRLRETPWDQALDVILRSHRLGQVLEGGVLRVGPLADLLDEQRDFRMHAEETALSGELVTLERRLAYVRPEEVREILEARLSERGMLVADPRTGTLLLRDVPARLEEIGSLIDALDIPVPGVEIEARIVLASRTLSQRLGIQWGGGIRDPSTGLGFPGTVDLSADAIGSGSDSFAAPGSGGILPPADRTGVRPGWGVDLPIDAPPTGAIGLALDAIGGLAHLDFALAAAERNGEVRILSAPRIVAQNARPATIKQGVTFPVQVVANNTVTVQFQDAVLELTVTPQVSPGGTVLLDLEVSNDSLDFGQSVGGIPSIVTQRATTRVRVGNGETTVIGGVFAQQESDARDRVPGLHRIPLLGHLFRSRQETRRDDELLIFLTPRIR